MPQVIDLLDVQDVAVKVLLMEHIETVSASADFFERFGRSLAELHRTTQPQFGLDHSNFIGATVQSNQPCADWSKFWIEHRLLFQVELARENGVADSQFNSLADKLLERVCGMLKTDEPPALIHGLSLIHI